MVDDFKGAATAHGRVAIHREKNNTSPTQVMTFIAGHCEDKIGNVNIVIKLPYYTQMGDPAISLQESSMPTVVIYQVPIL
ncbi:hypothetical protein CCACVL1_24536 [Corchorus capsularis]|uniref:Uncharacterized protein n=1 Tax=Corchorus capsularis TaxID=210143 RepID=A0A1R3GPC6_COCAP|nr:hypothetical protein CCACVL1_24536 [Corchorus capsularis]